MVNYTLPTSVTIDNKEYPINQNGDYRVVLDVISILNDEELSQNDIIWLSLCAFYGYDKKKNEFRVPNNAEEAVKEMFKFINCGAEMKENENEKEKPKLMDWEQDFSLIVPPLNKVLGYEVRAVKYLHWWSFVGAYMEIDGDCVFSQVKEIRRKKSMGEKLDKGEQKFYNDNKDIVILKKTISQQDKEWLESEE